MRFLLRPLFLLLVSLFLLASLAAADEGPLDKSQPKSSTPEDIIKRFASKEKEFKEARDQYTYRQDVKVQVLDGDTIKGEYHEVFDVLFDNSGKRLENVVFAPQSETKPPASMTFAGPATGVVSENV